MPGSMGDRASNSRRAVTSRPPMYIGWRSPNSCPISSRAASYSPWIRSSDSSETYVTFP